MTDQTTDFINPRIDPLLIPQARAYPYMFAGRFIELVMYDGWHAPFAKLCDDIDAVLGADKQGFCWIQLKEKFGQPRGYWELHEPSDLTLDLQFEPATEAQDQTAQGPQHLGFSKGVPGDMFDRIRPLVDAATSECDWRCAVCGQPGVRRTINGWLNSNKSSHPQAPASAAQTAESIGHKTVEVHETVGLPSSSRPRILGP